MAQTNDRPCKSWIVGIDLLTIEARVVVASIETYLSYADSLTEIGARLVAIQPRTLNGP